MITTQFWDYLEENLDTFILEIWANSQLMQSTHLFADNMCGEHANDEALEEVKKTLSAEIESILEGGRFQFLKDALCVVDEGEDKPKGSTLGGEADIEAQNASMSGDSGDDEAEEEGVELDDGGWVWVSCIDETENRSESGQPTEARRVWEWSRYDTEAEPWHFNRIEVRTGRTITPPPETIRAWEWTQYDSDAEREEAERKELL